MATTSPHAQAFIQRVIDLPGGPGVQLDGVLQPSLDDEAELRRLFAQDKTNPRLDDPLVGLVDVFAAPAAIRTGRARIPKDDEERSRQYVMPLAKDTRRQDGEPTMVADIDEFKRNWAVFTEGALSQLLDWNNIVAVGGAVVACVSPLPETAKRSVRRYYHSKAYPSSDIDLFLWGLSPEQAEAKIVQIYEAIRDSIPWDVTCLRTKNTVSIHSQYPYRPIQIVLRLYRTPAEILAGLDVDATCIAYDGRRVYATPRAIVAFMRQANTVDMTRRSPSYEVRLTKYAGRGFEIYVPDLRRGDIDPTIYERSILRLFGLARLLVLEKLALTDAHYLFQEARWKARGRPGAPTRPDRRAKRKLKGDLKASIGSELEGLEMSGYEGPATHVPYGPGWDARRIERLVFKADISMNSTFNPKNKSRRLHRHPVFFGTAEECIEDCCEHCPSPIDDDERKLQDQQDERYVRGRISFMQEDVGRQMVSGSFRPIDIGEWGAQAYVSTTARLFTLIAAGDRVGVAQMIASAKDQDPDTLATLVTRRDHVARAPLHLAILAGADEIASHLMERGGARMTARMVDGRNALHLAAQMGMVELVKGMLRWSEENASKAGRKDEGTEVAEGVEDDLEERQRLSSEDDWSSQDSDEEHPNPKSPSVPTPTPVRLEDVSQNPTDGGLPEDNADWPDVLDVNLPDFDNAFSPLANAILSGSLEVVDVLLAAGADPKSVLTTKDRSVAILPLMVTILREDDDHTCAIAERLIAAGATCALAQEKKNSRHELGTVLYRAVAAKRPNLVRTFLKCDPKAQEALGYPVIGWSGAVTPFVAAVAGGDYAMMAVLLAHGATVVPSQQDLDRAYGLSQYDHYERQYFHPIEAALSRRDGVVRLLVALGAPINLGVKAALGRYSRAESRRTYLDWVRYAQRKVDEDQKHKTPQTPVPAESLSGWQAYLDECVKNEQYTGDDERSKQYLALKAYFADMEGVLLDNGAKSWSEVYPEHQSAALEQKLNQFGPGEGVSYPVRYWRMTGGGAMKRVDHALEAVYDELYEACFNGDNETIQKLCVAPPSGMPLQISVVVAEHTQNQYWNTGYTPLFAAFSRRHWETTRLIISIVAAQYQIPEKKEDGSFTTSGIHLDDDDDDSDNDSDDSNETVDPEAVTFVDVAGQPTTVKTRVHPRHILQTAHQDLFSLAIKSGDLDVFLNVFRLYKHSPLPVEIPSLEAILLRHNRVEMLDEYIRRTGRGIKVAIKPPSDDAVIVNDSSKIYLGLNVHGKKRADLAKGPARNAMSDDEENFQMPLVWSAAGCGAISVLDYLLGDRPLAAYEYYATNNISDTAKAMKRIPELSKVLPERMGWNISLFGESPLTTAILSKQTEAVKFLFKKMPQLMVPALHERITLLGVNPFMLAVYIGCELPLIDFLLAQGVSADETDQDRCNIFHHATEKNNEPLMLHLLSKLPRETVERLLLQQSKRRLNTVCPHSSSTHTLMPDSHCISL
ncbi:ankyrin repeat protein [Mycena amicta]|nr:ankyrin repeat protein [Mycena amicta]